MRLDNPYQITHHHLPSLPDGIGVGSGSLFVGGLAWLRARVYDPTTYGFLTRDPLPALPGVVWEANPYNYAANNPLSLSDPLGLKPVTDKELAAYNNTRSVSFWERAGNFVNDHAYLVAGLAVVAGVALMLSPLSGPALVMAVAAGQGLFNAGSTIAVQKFFGEDVSLKEVAIAGMTGLATGSLLGWSMNVSKAANGVKGLFAMTGTNAAAGGTSSIISYTFSEDEKTAQGYIASFISGGVAGGIGGLSGPAGGTIARTIGQRSTSALASGITATINFGGGFAASITNDLMNSKELSIANATMNGAFSGILSPIADRMPGQQGTHTLEQASYFSVRSSHGLVRPTGPNGSRLIKSSLAGAAIGELLGKILEFME
ncbi:RHS repeat domain-containing protein [Arcanobacterium phocae]|uniref:RHS repeat domain-containing protein n=1 Tax=Arcanobacterium phocae TaxID=131112 RepID=UPI0020A219D1|nr:RHS repeat-associated core domain-containing protein [Arcanobacterium phocae]